MLWESQQALGDQGCWLYHAVQGSPGKLTKGVIAVVGKDTWGKGRKRKRPQPVKKPQGYVVLGMFKVWRSG